MFSAPIHETSISFVDMVMADIAFDGCVGSYWVLGLQALLLNWRDGYNVTFFVCYLWKVDKNLVSVVKSHMMSHVITTYIPLMHSMMSYHCKLKAPVFTKRTRPGCAMRELNIVTLDLSCV